jgi:hypothetical protein
MTFPARPITVPAGAGLAEVGAWDNALARLRDDCKTSQKYVKKRDGK